MLTIALFVLKPVHTVGGLCANGSNSSISTISATPTGNGPNTYVFEGTTLTSPTVYLSFAHLAAVSTNIQYWNTSYTTTIGPNLTNVVVPEAPNKVSSVCGIGTTAGIHFFGGDNMPQIDNAVSLDYARLQQPVHAADYFCALGPDLLGELNLTGVLASTIFVENYNPTLLFPSDLADYQPGWSTCFVGTQDTWVR